MCLTSWSMVLGLSLRKCISVPCTIVPSSLRNFQNLIFVPQTCASLAAQPGWKIANKIAESPSEAGRRGRAKKEKRSYLKTVENCLIIYCVLQHFTIVPVLDWCWGDWMFSQAGRSQLYAAAASVHFLSLPAQSLILLWEAGEEWVSIVVKDITPGLGWLAGPWHWLGALMWTGPGLGPLETITHCTGHHSLSLSLCSLRKEGYSHWFVYSL